VPFIILRSTLAFLPLNPTTWTFEKTGTEAYKHFTRLDKLYRAHAKEGASAQTLLEVINYRSKLTAREQMSPMKVVVNESGTQLKAAIVIGRTVVTKTLYYYSPESPAEAMYFASLIQAPVITKDVQLRQAEGAGGHGRHIEKRAYEYPFPRFDRRESLHMEIVKLGNEMREHAYKIASDFIQVAPLDAPPLAYVEDEPKIPTQRIRNAIYSSLSNQYALLDELVLELLGVASQ
jgi:hypothetical protein